MQRSWKKRFSHSSNLIRSMRRAGGKRAWKGFPWSVMDQLHAKGSDPATKYKSVCLSEEGARSSEKLCEKLFAVK